MLGRALGIAVLALILVLSSDAFAKGGGHGGGRGGGHGHGGGHGFRGHGGKHHHFGGHRGGFARHAVGRAHFGGRGFSARHANFGHVRHAALAPGHKAMKLLSRRGALSGKLLSSPTARMQIAAAAALAGWHGGASGNGWWRHGNGGYGWVGPMFWPFAYNDIYDYAVFDDGLGFWGYGYPDIYAGIFPPYGYSELAGYFPQRRGDRRRGRPVAIGQMCGNDSRAIAGMPVDQIADAVQPTEAQLAALSELGQASLTAAQNIRMACPAQAMLTAPGRLAVMQQRIEAMVSGVALIQPRLDRFYGLLNDEQKARLNALAEEQRKVASAGGASPAQSCNAPGPVALQWPTSEIEARIHPNDTQKGALQVLQDTSGRAAEQLKAACQTEQVLTPPARLAAAAKRLDAMLDAVKQVRAVLEISMPP